MDVRMLGPLVSRDMIYQLGCLCRWNEFGHQMRHKTEPTVVYRRVLPKTNKNGLFKHHRRASAWQHATLPAEGSVFYHTSIYQTVSAYILYVLSQEPKSVLTKSTPMHSYPFLDSQRVISTNQSCHQKRIHQPGSPVLPLRILAPCQAYRIQVACPYPLHPSPPDPPNSTLHKPYSSTAFSSVPLPHQAPPALTSSSASQLSVWQTQYSPANWPQSVFL